MITSNIFLDTEENELEDSDGLLWSVSGYNMLCWVQSSSVYDSAQFRLDG